MIPASCKNQDMVIVQVLGQIKNKFLIERVSELILESIIPNKLTTPVDVTINVLTECDEQAGGFCWGDNTEVEIEIARTSHSHEYSRKSILTNLAHELIHAKQFIAGESSPDKNMESEAYGWEERLYEKYFRKLNV